ncbi:MAG: extracellular solute-binding protein [Planctomycetaceae bacterium]|nr:extracellular solute-binding protein [Planctomycetaceae bacterium]
MTNDEIRMTKEKNASVFHSSFAIRHLVILLAVPFSFSGCAPQSAREVIVYTSLDEEFSKPIFAEFTRETGIEVRGQFDVESTKSVGLTQRIMKERARPPCDLFWNNEAVNTLRLDREGLLAEYDSPMGRQFPPQYRSPTGTWYGFAARARVLIVNTKLVSEAERPDSIFDLVDPQWKDRCGIAKPLAGTTATHAACLFAAWGDERAEAFFAALKGNCRVLGGNKQVARAVADGELAFGLTDTDDAIVELEAGMPVAIVFPDQRPAVGGDVALGTLKIPNTLAIIRGAERRTEAELLLDYLLSPAVEERLAGGPSAQLPLNPAVTTRSRAAPQDPLVWMEVDFNTAAAKWDDAARFLRDEFATAE